MRIAFFRPAPSLCLMLCLLVPAPGQAAPALQCVLEQGGETRIAIFPPSADPYRVEAIDVGRRFRFKAVVVAGAAAVDYVKLYAYYRKDGQPVLLHQASYLAPAVGASSLTGEQRIYSPQLGVELLYNCTLLEQQP